MPNYCLNKVTLKGPAQTVAAFKENHLRANLDESDRTGYELVLDFNDFVPMSPSLDIDESALNEGVYELFHGTGTSRLHFILSHLKQTYFELENNLNAPEARADLIALCRKLDPSLEKLANTQKSNEELYGFKTWYGWRCHNWGTKWNAFWLSVNKFELPPEGSKKLASLAFQFTTAWSPPEPVFEAMAARYPELNIVVHWSEEGGGKGKFKFAEGEIVSE